MTKQRISTDRAPAAVGPYSQAILAGDTLYCSGQIPLNPAGELLTLDIVAQTRQVMENLRAVLEAAGGTLADIVKTTIYCVDLSEFQAINETYATFFTADPPARATVQVAALPKGARIEI